VPKKLFLVPKSSEPVGAEGLARILAPAAEEKAAPANPPDSSDTRARLKTEELEKTTLFDGAVKRRAPRVCTCPTPNCTELLLRNLHRTLHRMQIALKTAPNTVSRKTLV
jgi:hypothetical protein